MIRKSALQSRLIFLRASSTLFSHQKNNFSSKQNQKKPGVRADDVSGNEGRYDHTRDKNFRNLSFQIGAFFVIVFASGKLMGFLIDRYMFDGASKGLTEGSK